MADYATLFGERYAASNDESLAQEQTIQKMRLYWSRSEVNRGRLTLYAPEREYKPVDGSFSWMRTLLESDLKSRLGKLPDDYAIVADRSTEADITAHQPPSYLITIKQPDGTRDVLRTPDNRPLRYRWDPQAPTEQARENFERQRKRVMEGQELGRGLVPAL
jgi:hypothetical protein